MTSSLPLFDMAVAVGLLSAGAKGAEKDKPGTRDHPVLGRYAGSVLHNQGVINFERVVLPLGGYDSVQSVMKPLKSKQIEGKVSSYLYWGPRDRSELEVFRNYQAALQKAGFTILYVCDEPARCQSEGLSAFASAWTSKPSTFAGGYDALSRMEENGHYPPRFLVAQRQRPEGEVHASLTVQPASSTQKDKGVGAPYYLQIIETKAMRTDAVTVDAAELQKGLAVEGRVALYGVLFDTGSAVVKPESKAQLDEMARLLTQSPTLKVFIVGHTDNVGEFQSNLSLSQRRADAVVASLSQGHKIDTRRLGARGIANVSPLASNDSDAGRARNRRVELVSQ